jgi:hypothetical protein
MSYENLIDKSSLEGKVESNINNIARNLLDILESIKFGRIQQIEKDENYNLKIELIEKEFIFLRKKILDLINDSKRQINSSFKGYKIEEKNRVIINLGH